jgi:hypothetical protein
MQAATRSERRADLETNVVEADPTSLLILVDHHGQPAGLPEKHREIRAHL